MVEPGTTLQGKYLIERVLGQGGMGKVYLARQQSLGDRPVAIKETTLRLDTPELQAQADALFRREAEILASLEHPNLVDVKDYFEENGSRFIVMGYVDGETLDSVMQRATARVKVDQVLGWADALCDVLTMLHEHDPPVIVRDLKPANVMLDHAGRIRLIDFGLSRVLTSTEATSPILAGAGTAGFAPLEQLSGGTDARADVYGLGATIYALLTRRPPPSAPAIASGQEKLEPPSTRNPGVSHPLDEVVLKMMASRPDERYPTIREARKALAVARVTIPLDEASAEVTLPPRKCMTCGSVITPSMDRCERCGRELRAKDEPVRASSAMAAAPSEERAERSWSVLALLGVLLLVGAAGWLSIARPGKQKEAPARSVFPLVSGYSWKYRTTVGSTSAASEWTMKVLPADTVAGAVLYPVEVDGLQGRYTEWYSLADGWVLKHKFLNVATGFALEYRPVMRYLHDPLVEGDTWDWSGTGLMGPSSHKDKVLGAETVEVPAGSFLSARVQSDLNQGGQTTTVLSWWAPGVGCVQSQWETAGVQYRSALVDYSFK